MKKRNFVIKVLRYITIILFLLIIMIVVIKKWHLIQIWIKCLSQLNRVDIQLAKLNVPIFILCKISCYIHNNIKRNFFQVPLIFNGANEGNRTPITALARPYSNHWTTFAKKMEGPTGFEPVIRVLQTHALPLGYRATTM